MHDVIEKEAYDVDEGAVLDVAVDRLHGFSIFSPGDPGFDPQETSI